MLDELACDALGGSSAEPCVPRLQPPPLPAEWELVQHFKIALGMPNRSERAALAKLCMLARKTGFCWMAQAELAELVDTSPRTLSRWIAKWRKAGLVRTVDRQSTHHTYPQWETLRLPMLRAIVASPSRHAGESRLLTEIHDQQQKRAPRAAAEQRCAPPAAPAPAPAPPPVPLPAPAALARAAGPAVEPDALLLRRLEREHGAQAPTMVRTVLARVEARQHPEAARVALRALGTYRRSEVRKSVGHLLTWLVREAIAGREQLGTLVQAPAAVLLRQRTEECEQTGRWQDAAKLRALAHRLGRMAAAEQERELLQAPTYRRMAGMIDATLQDAVRLPPSYVPAPRELQAPVPITDRRLARVLAPVLALAADTRG